MVQVLQYKFIGWKLNNFKFNLEGNTIVQRRSILQNIFLPPVKTVQVLKASKWSNLPREILLECSGVTEAPVLCVSAHWLALTDLYFGAAR